MFATNRIVALKPLTTAVLALIPICLAPSALFGATFNIPDGDVAALIAAIQTVNSSCAATTTINLAPGGTYTLTAVAENTGEYNGPGAVGLPVVRVSIIVNGNGATIQRSTVFGTPDFVPLAVSGRTAAGPPSCYPDPILTLNQTVLTGGTQGGLHINSAAALVQGSTVTQNRSVGLGGGINNACGTLTLLNSTVSHNTSDSAWGGGGILMWDFSCAPDKPVADISFSTIFENSNPFWGRGTAIGIGGNVGSGRIRLKNSILASPSYPSEVVCNSGNNILLSLGHNILGDDKTLFGSSCPAALIAPGDMINTNPLLGVTSANGGLTPTSLPLTGSPAINAVPLAYCTEVDNAAVSADQRGVSRPKGSACDIGAVELDLDATPPLISAQLSANPAPLGTAVMLTATASDVGRGDSNIVSAEYSVDSGVTWQPFAGTYGYITVIVSTGLTLPKGVYGICVRATDAGQNTSGPSCTEILAVYDPSGGFVTGGGWINSPQGAYTPNPSVTGKASFGFLSKYQNGAATPTGETQFQFNAGSFRFKSTAYDWLVIAGARAQYKGTGTVNGAGEYGFMLTAIDGDANGGGYVDKFRIKIWTVTDGNVVYDNQLGAFDGANPVTALGGGSIVIHR